MKKYKTDRLMRVFPELQRKPHNQGKKQLSLKRNLFLMAQRLKTLRHL